MSDLGDEAETAGLKGLAERYRLTSAQSTQLLGVLAAISADPRAPTSGNAATHALDVHLADSLVALELECVSSATRIADLGSGAGFPGLVLACALPAAVVSLVESNARKCAFIAAVADAASLANARVVGERAEAWRGGIGAHDLVTARALAPQGVVLEYAAPLLRVGGALVDWRGRRAEADEGAALRAAAELGLERVEVRKVQPYDGARDHHLHVFAKVLETPERFPRRVGMARKRPLG